MREQTIEQKLKSLVSKKGGWALKLSSPGTSGLPDRLLLFPQGRVGFVEVKAPGQKPRALQEVQMNKLRKLGFPVFVLDDPRQIQHIIDGVKYGIRTT